jgi:hypothetical protein
MMSIKEQKGGKLSKPEKKNGRPSKYHTHVLPHMDAIKAMMRNGATMEILSDKLNVSIAALSDYKVKFPEFKEALIISGEFADMTIENAFYDMAKTDRWAAFTWLKNRQPKRWRDKQHIFQTSSTVVRKDYDHMTEDELEKEMQQLEGILPDEPEDDTETDGGVH